MPLQYWQLRILIIPPLQSLHPGFFGMWSQLPDGQQFRHGASLAWFSLECGLAWQLWQLTFLLTQARLL